MARINEYTNKYDVALGQKFSFIQRVDPYINCDTPIKYKCALHGEFYRSPASLVNSIYGCSTCGRQAAAKSKIKSEDSIVNRIFDKHKDSVLLISKYTGIDKPHKFKCKEDHYWTTTPSSIVNGGSGCPACSNKLKAKKFSHTNKQVKDRLFKLYENKICLVGKYKGAFGKKHLFKCDESHEWFTSLSAIMYGKSGCPYCSNTSSSKLEKQWLSLIKLKNSNILDEKVILRIPSIPYAITPDGYDPITKTIYEFHGDYWHGHVSMWDSNKTIRNLSMRELNKKTRKREKALLKAGYKVVYCWEADFKRYLKSRFRYKRVPFTVAELSKSPYCY